MYLEIQAAAREKFVRVVKEVYNIDIAEPVLGYPPNVDLGELSITSCFELARQLRRPPRQIAAELAPRLLPIQGVERVSVAGAGYLNLHLDRAVFAQSLLDLRSGKLLPEAAVLAGGKILVEHTSINPNKAAHIGHLRNAALGDTFVRLLRFRGRTVEVQNYVDNTGVQVADVVVGFAHLEKKTVEEVRRVAADPAVRFDYYCWDLYARVFQWYEENPDALKFRAAALKDIEEGRGEMAALAETISTAIVRLHLETMQRLNVGYDLLVQEGEILHLHFWASAFEMLKRNGTLRYEDSGKNCGCWVMSLSAGDESEPAPNDGAPREGEDSEVKIIVRSNGTVTYVGKDIAYHLWKFALLGKDFGYEPFYTYPSGATVWRTNADPTMESSTPFGHASGAYAVIDTRQSYLQNVVAAALRVLGYTEQADNLHHFAYEVVNLSLTAAAELGIEISAEDRERNYVEVSGRKGLGVKADDLIDLLVAKALEEVKSREMTAEPAEQESSARMIAVAALRYFLLKYTRRSIIAFDFKEALAFEGETGPYLQYSVVRARNIFRKFQESTAKPVTASGGEGALSREQLKVFFSGDDGRDFWELALVSAQLEMLVEQAIAGEEPAVVAKYAFRLAQAWNNFYHHHRILSEPDPARQRFLLDLVSIASNTLAQAVELLGIEIPERM